MRTGVYRKVEGHTGVGMFYQFLHLAREHTTGEQAVVYIPLRVEPEWAGTVRPCHMPRAAFERKFEYVGEGLPEGLALRAFPFDAWHEDDHDVLWWHFPIHEPPYVGSPLASSWPFGVGDEHALGWTRFTVPTVRTEP